MLRCEKAAERQRVTFLLLSVILTVVNSLESHIPVKDRFGPVSPIHLFVMHPLFTSNSRRLTSTLVLLMNFYYCLKN